MRTSKPVLRALLSVSDKTGIVDFAKKLHDRGVEILSTGGTAKLLVEHQIPVVPISDFTGFPEIMEGRVKTLHPAIFAGILNRPGKDEAVLAEHHFSPIDLVVVNLYPFQQVLQQEQASFDEKIENIDIGGSSLLRAAAKNHAFVTIICDFKDYDTLLEEMDAQKGATLAKTRLHLAQKAFAHSAQYDAAIAAFFAQENQDSFPDSLTLSFKKQQDLRYGENPHQQAAFYTVTEKKQNQPSQLLQGKALSFNNLVDADTAYQCVQAFEQAACVIVKHANPCGVAQAATLLDAYNLAYQTDPVSAFGGVIAFNQILDAKLTETLLNRQFVEVVIAPGFTQSALELFKQKPNIRLLCQSGLNTHLKDYKFLPGGLLVQDANQISYDPQQLRVVSKKQPSPSEWQDLLFAWKVVKFVKSNAIVFAKDNMTLGVGAGQMSRIDSTFIAAQKAASQNLTLQNAVMASDAFFPFRDNIDAAAQAGITAIIQPGGSLRDAEVIAAADDKNMAMVLTNIRHFRH